MIKNQPITITNAITISDGGTKYLVGNDYEGNEFSFLIAQHLFSDNFNSTQIPGRLHYNNDPIDVRSKFEKDLIKSLENCFIKIDSTKLSFVKGIEEIKGVKNLLEANEKGDVYGVAYLIKYIIDFIKSDNYIEIARNLK